MGKIHFKESEVLTDEKVGPLSLGNIVGTQEEDSAITASEFKRELHKMIAKLSLYLDASHQKSSQQCIKESCPSGENFNFSSKISFLSDSKNLEQHSLDLSEFRACRTAPLFHIPQNLRSSEFAFGKSKGRKTRSVNDLSEFILEYFMTEGSRIPMYDPLEQRMYESIKKAIKGKIVPNRSLFLNLGALDDALSRFRARSNRAKSIEYLEFDCSPSPSPLGDTSRHELNGQISELKVSDSFHGPCSSSNSTCSHQSTLPSQTSFSKGVLLCAWKSGIPYFMFSVNDMALVANSHKIDSLAHKALDYMYLFHQRVRSKKSCRSNAAEFVAKMKVSSSFVVESSGCKFMETEFVLFAASEDHSTQMQTSSSYGTKNKALSKKVAEIFRPSPSLKQKSTNRIGEPSFQYPEFLQDPFLSELCNMDELGWKSHLDFPPSLELAAIVLKDERCNTKKEQVEGGWGLKFLKNVRPVSSDTCIDLSSSSETHEECHSGSRKEAGRTMKVLVPAGLHAGSNSRNGGPSRLIERWRSGGNCDCGGWDIGCPIKVLQNTNACKKYLQQDEPQDGSRFIDFCMEGAGNGGALLKMANIGEGVHDIYFHSTLSALQAFSIGIAVIHSQTPALHPEL